MQSRCVRLRSTLSVCLLSALYGSMVSPAISAPPTPTYLFPAGAQRGTTIEVATGGTLSKWPVDVWVSGRGVSAKAAADKGKLTVTVAADAVPGVYWLRLTDDDGVSGARPFVVGTLPEVREQEPNDDPKKPQPIDKPCVVNGRLEKNGDVDCYAVPLKKGQTLVAALEANTTLRSPMDGVLQVASADGFVLASNNDHTGLDPLVAFEAPKDGSYVIRAFAFPATPDSSIRFAGGEAYVYRLTLTTSGYADYPWPLAVARDGPEKVEVIGWNVPAAAKALTVKPDDPVMFHPEVANSVRVLIERHACVARPVGAEPYALASPVTVSGRLREPQAIDSYVFTANKGQRLVAHVESSSLGLPVAPVIAVADSAGKELTRAEPPGLDRDTELAFTAPANGLYTLTVRDRFGDGGPRHAYRLRLVPPTPDFALALKADQLALDAGKSLDVPVTLQRLNGFAGDVDLSVDGLPLGVRSETAAGPNNQLTLRLTAEGESSATVRIRVRGRAKGDPTMVRLAAAPLGEFNATPPDIWLTVRVRGRKP
ncbi:MAG: PPC domain-containing protein [Gemmataceae bacterium]